MQTICVYLLRPPPLAPARRDRAPGVAVPLGPVTGPLGLRASFGPAAGASGRPGECAQVTSACMQV